MKGDLLNWELLARKSVIITGIIIFSPWKFHGNLRFSWLGTLLQGRFAKLNNCQEKLSRNENNNLFTMEIPWESPIQLTPILCIKGDSPNCLLYQLFNEHSLIGTLDNFYHCGTSPMLESHYIRRIRVLVPCSDNPRMRFKKQFEVMAEKRGKKTKFQCRNFRDW